MENKTTIYGNHLVGPTLHRIPCHWMREACPDWVPFGRERRPSPLVVGLTIAGRSHGIAATCSTRQIPYCTSTRLGSSKGCSRRQLGIWILYHLELGQAFLLLLYGFGAPVWLMRVEELMWPPVGPAPQQASDHAVAPRPDERQTCMCRVVDPLSTGGQ
jgi:hypothetical protein